MSVAGLLEAAFDGDLEKVRQLISSEPFIVNRGDRKNAAIHSAASNNQADVVSLLLDKGANIDAKDEDGMTAPHRAAAAQQLRAARVLIERGADLNVFDDKGYTPIALALIGHSSDGVEIAELLLRAGSKHTLIDACLLGHSEDVQTILEKDSAAVNDIPSHEMLVSGIMGVDIGSFEHRMRILEVLFAHGLKPNKEFVLQQIESLKASNMVMFVPVLERYLGGGTA